MAGISPPRIVTWEVTRRCNLKCAHCRASSVDSRYENELSTEEGYRLIDSILDLGKPMLILTGGEPLLRNDIFDLAKYAAGKGLMVSVGSNGTTVTEEIAAQMKQVPISRLSISIDFSQPEMQDKFRGEKGAFDSAMAGIRNAQQAGVGVQINSTLTKFNIDYIDDLLSMAINTGAVAFHPFLLVPTGRGKHLKDGELSPQECERAFRWISRKSLELEDTITIKPTCAPFYWRIMHQESKEEEIGSMRRGCLAGTGFCFISHVGRVQGCGYLDFEAGDIRKQSFTDIWQNSPLFNEIRDLSRLKGRCGACEYKAVCGGCRARAYESTGDYLQAEPYCIYHPKNKK